MRFQAASLFLPLASLLAQLAQGADANLGDASSLPSDCKSSTLTWIKNRAKSADPTISHEGFALSIRDTYNRSTPILPVKVGDPIQSPDKEFTITHGDVNAPALALTWRGQKFELANINVMRVNMTDKEYIFEHDYWLCIMV
ncbi:hypothetical protein BGZ96_011635 [Linnemannia gamsii]|uniref:Uncharacterized protein n=1 Tax=Linnemannia gamsii TaxID=64522 RepID=A0ABQ7JS02_9FUNG|nr:hypothetical protein BGZ96_011635 [Linnemannia gamsii]